MNSISRFFIQLTLVLGIVIAPNGLLAAVAEDSEKTVAIYYGAKPPVNNLSQFDRIILESENIKAAELKHLKQHGASTYAYLSIGEVGPQRNWKNQIQPAWTMGVNTAWDSTVMDLTSNGWQRFILERVTHLVGQGYDGLFLDTMDSYQIYAKDDAARNKQEDALANLIYRIKKQHPSLKLISNRGFEVINKIAGYLDAVAAESLYSRWNSKLATYQPVPEADRQWLLGKLNQVKSNHQLDIISIDYVAPADREKARDIAKNISQHGFIPWVSTPSLDYVGISNIEVLPREVIMLYDSRVNGRIEFSEVHTLLAMPLEYMGYVPVYHDIALTGLPQGTLKGAYAGLVSWHRENIEGDIYASWLNKQLDDKLPLAMFGSMGTPLTGSLADRLGVVAAGSVDPYSLKPSASTNMVGFEAPVPSRIDQFAMSLRNNSADNTTHLRFTDKSGTELDTVVTGPWGGLALHPTIIDFGLDPLKDWIVDPFSFLKTSLQLIDAPMPDITSENGTRLWFAHIDGDAMPSWAELPGRKLGSEIIRDEIIKRYELPHAISVVEAEMYTPDRRERMEKTARDLFELDYVEIASHTYSHPFHWQALQPGSPSGENNLPIPGYQFDIDREIGGSAHYINTHLAPPGKKTEILLWSGDAIPLEDAIEAVGRYGMINMNGGATIISKKTPTVTAISPNVRTVGKQTQVYAPIMNENIFTNDWLGPFDGFRRVIETFDMTGYPRRIKPVNVYYHFYAGTKKSALRSLEEVYDWSLQQDLMPILPSEYIVKVPHFRSAGVSRYLDGRWKVSGLGPIKSIRTLDKNSYPDLSTSKSLIGTSTTDDAIYIHTNGANSVTFNLTPLQPVEPYLVSSNASVEHWNTRSDGTISVRFTGALQVKFEIGGSASNCEMTLHGEILVGERTPYDTSRFNLTTKDTGDAIIDCET